MNFFASVLVHQDVQKKIHRELDAVVGRNRTPILSDLSSLTYFRVVWMESMRLNPTTPTGMHLSRMCETNQPYPNFQPFHTHLLVRIFGKAMSLPKARWSFQTLGEKFIVTSASILTLPPRFMMIDPRLWGDDTNIFKPERFLVEGAKLPDPESLAFGFGRR
jgi:cytochrome P450